MRVGQTVISKEKEGIVSGQVTPHEEEEWGLMQITSSSFGEMERARVTDHFIGAGQKIPDRLRPQLGG